MTAITLSSPLLSLFPFALSDLFSFSLFPYRLLRSLLFAFDLFSSPLISSFPLSIDHFFSFPIDRSVLASYLFSSFNLFPSHFIEFPLVLSPSISYLIWPPLLVSLNNCSSLFFDLLMAPSLLFSSLLFSSLLFSSLLFSSLLFSSLLLSSLLLSSLLFSSLLFSSLLFSPALSDDSRVSPIARGNALSNLCRKAWGIVVIAYSRQTEGYWFQLDLTRTDKDKTVLSYNHVKHVLTEEFIQVSQEDYTTMSSMVRMLQFMFVSCSCSKLPYSLHSRILFVSLLSL